ncbi:MAG TPA: hypothetical protein PLO53_02240 [Candidatus Hydrogenedentes bacterium]|nr:hypothetical protein [Candidatus Hydrogenedentota bacterium]
MFTKRSVSVILILGVVTAIGLAFWIPSARTGLFSPSGTSPVVSAQSEITIDPTAQPVEPPVVPVDQTGWHAFARQTVAWAVAHPEATPDPELLSRFADCWKYDLSDTQRADIERDWLARLSAGSMDRWLRLVAMEAAGFPELALRECDALLGECQDPAWRELAWDARTGLLLRSVRTPEDALADTLSRAAEEVPADTLEHIVAMIRFRGPRAGAVLTDGTLCPGHEITVLGGRFSTDWSRRAGDLIASVLPDVVGQPGYQLVERLAMVDQVLKGRSGTTMLLSAAADSGGQAGAAETLLMPMLDLYATMQDGPELEAAILWLPDILFNNPNTFAESAVSVRDVLVNLAETRTDPAVRAAAREALIVMVDRGVISEDVSTRVEEAQMLLEERPEKPWLDEIQERRERALRLSARSVFSSPDPEAIRVALVNWLREHPCGPVASTVLENGVSRLTRPLLLPPFEPRPLAVVAAEIPSPEPVWSVSTLFRASLLAGGVPLFPEVSADRKEELEPMVKWICAAARGLTEPNTPEMAGNARGDGALAEAIAREDGAGVLRELIPRFEAGQAESRPDQRWDLAAALSVMRASTEDLRALIEESRLARNPRVNLLNACMRLVAGQRLLSSGQTVPEEFTRNWVFEDQWDYLEWLGDQGNSELIQKARAAVLAVLYALCGNQSAERDKLVQWSADTLLNTDAPNPWAARMLWPIVFDRARRALAEGDDAAARRWMERFAAVTARCRETDLPFYELPAAERMAERCAMYF